MADETTRREVALTPSWFARHRGLALALVFVGLFVVLLLITFPDGRATRFQGIPADATAAEATPKMGLGDSRRYIEVGEELGVDHELSTANEWVLNYWPPGMHVFYGSFFFLFGPDMPVGLVTGVALCAIWALVLTLWVDLLLRYVPVWAVALTIGAVVLADTTREWIFGLGLFWSEGLYTACMLFALYAAARVATATTTNVARWWAVVVGLGLAASAYVRVTSELVGRALTIVAVGWAILAFLRRAVRRAREKRGTELRPLHSWNEQLIALVLAMVAFQAATIPWRIIAAQTIRHDDYSWTTATNRYWDDQWTPDHVWARQGRHYLIAGGANTACKLDPEKCRRIARLELRSRDPYSGFGHYTEAQFRQMALDTFRAHPWEFVGRRAATFPAIWFGAPVPIFGDLRSASDFEVPPLGPDPHSQELLQNGLLLVLLAGLLVVSVVRIRRVGPELLTLLVPILFAAITAGGVVLHWENRWYYPVKLIAIPTFVVLLGLELAHRRSPEAEPEPEPTPAPEPAPV